MKSLFLSAEVLDVQLIVACYLPRKCATVQVSNKEWINIETRETERNVFQKDCMTNKIPLRILNRCLIVIPWSEVYKKQNETTKAFCIS